jgi:AcrR family transcriptional regulator
VCHTVSTVGPPVATDSRPARNTAAPAKARRSREQSRAGIVEAANELFRERSYAELSVGDVMKRAGLERTIFYRHFDDLGDLMVSSAEEAVGGLLAAQVDLGGTRDGSGTHPEALPAALEPCVLFFESHGPLLRALSEAAGTEKRIADGQDQMRRRFDELVADSLAELPQFSSYDRADLIEIARALNLLNSAYLLEAFGHQPRVSAETALQTLTEIWAAVLRVPAVSLPAGDGS